MSLAFSPYSLPEALGHLAAEPGLVPLAGCTDLMVAGASQPVGVIDLLGIPELSGIREVSGGVEIGATTAFTAIHRSSLVQATFPALAAAAGEVGGWQIQNRATLGGNLANASPAGDSLPVLLALGAVIGCASAAHGQVQVREVPAESFFLSYRRTALVPGELIAWVRLPLPAPGTVQAFRKVGTRAAQAISKVVVALSARVEDGCIAALQLGAGSVAATPVRLRQAEAAGLGQPLGAETASRVGRAAAAEVSPIDDVRSTADYRRFALERVVRRLVLSLVNGQSP